ncbi:ECF transporter S component [Oscillibacter ruminantium]|uniref:ECF transporter S component n=1 Tax=Oscillibacter ruminantium TaxID=1263547 RepID=UPI000304B4BB|nr:ECF transporter S component [Oscillibacter ruminantium]MDN0033785.1 ECF transporter S component [Oscillibacter valericigenes]MEA5042755.1 ECF transporter S component [Oscillibacter ruminantium]
MSQLESAANRRSLAKSRTHRLTVAAMLSAVATVLMFVDFSVPFMPAFIKLDISELPALLASFSIGPWYGVAVCLVKNIINCLRTSTGGVGELCNFMLGAIFVGIAGVVYQRFHKRKSRKGAFLGALIGAAAMAVLSVPVNYYLTYPIYAKFMPIDTIVGMYQAIRPSANGLLDCLVTFNMPFTFLKGILDVALCFLIYKPLSPLLHR